MKNVQEIMLQALLLCSRCDEIGYVAEKIIVRNEQ